MCELPTHAGLLKNINTDTCTYIPVRPGMMSRTGVDGWSKLVWEMSSQSMAICPPSFSTTNSLTRKRWRVVKERKGREGMEMKRDQVQQLHLTSATEIC